MTSVYAPIDELAKQLSVKVTTVRSWLQKGHIPKHAYIKVGSTYRFDIPAVITALRGDVVEATEAAAKEANEVVSAWENEEVGVVETPEQLEFDFNEDDDI